ncbi:TonB-dependent receptor [Catenovulum agarivorans DS-2]|uniref:TonB-dependent receptor n=1 Tax=Catenovulum agarivorans DS-2 TaxID=1328313 RepID=W7QKV4_9ALTE|nr:TonB-dependent receptor [Catenovulum agarivorans]EWH09577.1 TonB-dependent receptor [Catenovulum agarivorans DS-2]
MNNHFKYKAVAVAIMANFASTPLYAAEENSQNKTADEEIETIEITGFRGSIQRALNAKRFNSGVSDSIHAEDVGKSTDQNIGDALSRVTGVTVQEEDGEGTRISVRGAGAALNQVSMNGVALTGGFSGGADDASADNSVDLSSFSSDILSSIDVMKTSAADQDEGSLGATVVLRTIKPLNLNKRRLSTTIEGRYNEFSGEWTERLVGSYADKFLNDTLGVVFTVSQDTQKNRQDRIETEWNENALPIMDANAASGRTATSLQTGQPITLADGEEMHVLARNFTDFRLNTDKRERFTLSSGVQIRPTDRTDIQLDISHTTQTVTTDNHTLRINFAPEDTLNPNDPTTEWNVVDEETMTLEKSLRRAAGFINRNQGERELETNVVSLRIEQSITDNLEMELTAGYSRTTDETEGSLGLSATTWGTTGGPIVNNMDADLIEPVGYDCTEGSTEQCSFYTGTKMAIQDPFDGSWKFASSRFNPHDVNANHLSGFTFRDNHLTDTNKSLFLDFDWYLDGDYLTSLEFGVKYSEREKDVFTQSEFIDSGQSIIDATDPGADYSSTGMQSISIADMMSGEAFPYDDFLADVVDARSNQFFAGWPMLDAYKAITAFTSKDPSSIGISASPLGTRNIQTDTQVLYGKLNFELLDGQLKGNIGLRYVRDENRAQGVGGITYYRNPHLIDAYDLIVNRKLADIEGSQPCPEPNFAVDDRFPTVPGFVSGDPDFDTKFKDCWDWAITHAYVTGNANTYPTSDTDLTGEWLFKDANGNPDYSVNRLVQYDYATGQLITNGGLPNEVYLHDGSTVNSNATSNRNFNTAAFMAQYIDRSTAWSGPNGDQDNTTRRVAPVAGSNTISLLLPSLNLNYAIDEETVLRFAVSKTMARPQFDSLNPRLEITEDPWDNTYGQSGNINLKPLESNNLDISYEWYFNESSMLSAAVFYKDMRYFEETVLTPMHYKDVRTEYNLDNADLLMDYNTARDPGTMVEGDVKNCMPKRQVAYQAFPYNLGCDTAQIEVYKNGDGSEMRGVELGYTQNYDFLPGIWSGLGLSVNYTYQVSERDAEEIGTTGQFLKPLPLPYTPKHSANTTVFWEKDGISLRLANRYNSVQLVDQGMIGGATWQEATNRLDFSSSFKLTEQVSLTFQATNLTDDTRRVFYTASNTTPEGEERIVLDEGNAMEDSSITTNRTSAQFKTGRQFRVGIRATF